MTRFGTMFLQREQLQHHEQRVKILEQELRDHRRFAPEKGAKSRVIQEYVEKEQYLTFEVNYISILFHFFYVVLL